jgi:ketol-acid reductoisomerase
MPAKKWLDNQVSLAPLKNQTIAVIGYGIQGRAQTSNMKVLSNLRRMDNHE